MENPVKSSHDVAIITSGEIYLKQNCDKESPGTASMWYIYATPAMMKKYLNLIGQIFHLRML